VPRGLLRRLTRLPVPAVFGFGVSACAVYARRSAGSDQCSLRPAYCGLPEFTIVVNGRRILHKSPGTWIRGRERNL
jgi:hypothetical protein